MFTTREAVFERTGVEVDQTTLATAQLMIESYIGKSEGDVTDAGDIALLGNAVIFQSVYINGQTLDIMEQVALKSTTIGETSTAMNTDMMAPFLSPWSVMLCRNLTWMGTRSVHTGPVGGGRFRDTSWERA